jgi:hypothetical protein
MQCSETPNQRSSNAKTAKNQDIMTKLQFVLRRTEDLVRLKRAIQPFGSFKARWMAYGMLNRPGEYCGEDRRRPDAHVEPRSG